MLPSYNLQKNGEQKEQLTIGVDTSNYVYILSEDHAWVPGQVVESKGNGTALVKVPQYRDEHSIQSDGGRAARGAPLHVTVHLKDYPSLALPFQNVNEEGILQPVDDMVDLPFLHEAAILYNLKSRHSQSRPYTRTGDIIIAVNPYKWIHDLYSEERRNHYSKTLVWSKYGLPDPRKGLEPHVYEVSALAYRGLALEQQNQSILVSGESGAGKTETVKICMNHIASVQAGAMVLEPLKHTSGERNCGADGTSSPIVQRVLDSNPLLEAFGNAKTSRNDNSSRFGKYIQLQFDYRTDTIAAELKGTVIPECILAGSKCEVYLLEKSRVVGHLDYERSYHIFYQLLAAPEEEKVKIWSGLAGRNNESFNYIGWTDTHAIEGLTDAQHFQNTSQSLALIGVSGEKFTTLLRAICVVLQLGNITFVEDPKDSEKSVVDSSVEFELLADLMGLAPQDLAHAFTERLVKARGETFRVSNTAEKAKDASDAFAKEIYARSFLWLVREINDATCAEKNYAGNRREGFGIIGLLDIFGFESFEVNRFEQLCINYANEKLQQKFTQDIFQNVQEEYEYEGIELEEIKYKDNSDVLDLIEGQLGLLAVLDDECFRSKGNDKEFVYKAMVANHGSPCLMKEKMFGDHEFGIKHFAGNVVYSAESFVTKNTDGIPADLKDIAEKSSNKIIAMHLKNDAMINSVHSSPSPPVRHGTSRRRSTIRRGSTLMGQTVWKKFKNQLSALMDSLSQTRTRYIRCIKPNSSKMPFHMEHLTTVEQLRCAGVVAAVTISRSAFPNRLDHHVVLDRFKSLWPKNGPRSEQDFFDDRCKEDVETLLKSALVDLEVQQDNRAIRAFVMGRTRAYFRAGSLEYLEMKRLNGMCYWSTEIQRTARGYLELTRFRNQRSSCRRIQAAIRKCRAHRRFALMRECAVQIQCWYRCVNAQRLLVQTRFFYRVTKIQTRLRMRRARVFFLTHRRAAIQIQRIARGAVTRRKSRRMLAEQREKMDMKIQLEQMQRALEEQCRHQKEALERERKLALQQLEEERSKMLKDERRRIEDELALLKTERAALASSTQTSLSPVPKPFPSEQHTPTHIASEPGVIEVIKFIEKKPEAPIMTEEQQQLMEESGKIIEFLRGENKRLKGKLDQMKQDIAQWKETNTRLMEANASAAASFHALNQRAKQLNTEKQKLNKTNVQYKTKIIQMHADMTTRQRYYKQIADAYQEEGDARSFYEKALLDVVDRVAMSGDQTLVDYVMKKASECALVSQKLSGSVPDAEESETSY